MASGTIKALSSFVKSGNWTNINSNSYGSIDFIDYPALKLVWVFANSWGTAYTGTNAWVDLTGTLPQSIVPVATTSAITRKNGFLTVNSDRNVQFRLMKNQTWDQGYVVIPYE